MNIYSTQGLLQAWEGKDGIDYFTNILKEESQMNPKTFDWYTSGLAPMWRGPSWSAGYARFSGHFVDDFGTLIRVYEADENGHCAIME